MRPGTVLLLAAHVCRRTRAAAGHGWRLGVAELEAKGRPESAVVSDAEGWYSQGVGGELQEGGLAGRADDTGGEG